ncbi:hypothetical protein [Pseudoalteromonas sp. PS5]|uniref:hypothetical protein n=1 Tax=Pseudoalteromonas sp. PS5 TaxID=1437473 RepID=UPI000FFF454D|nr:hypothetical protein [Pseudoalteromonas sp. PS5]RXE96039.1 hypothetical protein D9603_19285 [Pseudoalteromonas sp. PS5]
MRVFIKRLERVIENLKSPFWEVYGVVIVLATFIGLIIALLNIDEGGLIITSTVLVALFTIVIAVANLGVLRVAIQAKDAFKVHESFSEIKEFAIQYERHLRLSLEAYFYALRFIQRERFDEAGKLSFQA